MSGPWPRVVPMGDRGLLVEFAPELSSEVNGLVRGADPLLARLPGVVETVPAFRSVLVVYEPRAVAFDDLVEQAERCARAAMPALAEGGRLVEIPVVYGDAAGPDLEHVADVCGLSPSEVVRLHSEPTYVVFMLGFAPGYPYLGLLPPPLRLPRRATPRTRVPSGSVAVADAFTGIYPQETPGGWHLLGRTPLRLFDPDRTPPCLLRPGDRVRFVPLASGAADLDRSQPAPAATAAPRRPVFEVVDSGLLTTVQDLGRRGWRRFGIPSSGALDRASLRAANAAVGNPPGAPAVELTFPGPRLRVLTDIEFAVAGADLDPRLNGAPVDFGDAVRARAGDLITFEAPRRGQWLYLSVAGGLDLPAVLGSAATYARGGLGGLAGRPLRAGDILGVGEAHREGTGEHGAGGTPGAPETIRVILGPQAEAFVPAAQAAFLGQGFEATVRRDRSGMRLRGPGLVHRAGAEVLSEGLLPGAIQIPADGDPVVILADGPTTGGYTKIAAVIDADLDRLAQATPGTPLRFEAVTVPEAHAAGETSRYGDRR